MTTASIDLDTSLDHEDAVETPRVPTRETLYEDYYWHVYRVAMYLTRNPDETEELGIPVGTVRSRISRGRAKVRVAMGKAA